MEQIFIQKIFALTEQILRGDYTFDPVYKELQSHLARAQKNKMPRYEAEALNTLAILYLVAGNTTQAQAYFSQGLQQADQTNDIDLKMKFLSNLSETCVSLWDLDTANQYLDRALRLTHVNNLNSLVSLYVYGNKINCWMLQGDYGQVATMLTEAWQRVENADLMKYSKYEYFQIILQLRNYDVLVHIALNQCDTAVNSLQIAEGLAKDAQAAELKVSTHLSRMYYELLCQKDEAAARQHEQTAIETSGGKLPGNTMLGIALYMKYNQRDDWAKQYAQQVLEAASDPSIPVGAIARAENLVKVMA